MKNLFRIQVVVTYDLYFWMRCLQINELAHGTRSAEAATHMDVVDISQFLQPAGVLELRYCRMLSDLCSLTYFMHKVTVSFVSMAMSENFCVLSFRLIV